MLARQNNAAVPDCVERYPAYQIKIKINMYPTRLYPVNLHVELRLYFPGPDIFPDGTSAELNSYASAFKNWILSVND